MTADPALFFDGRRGPGSTHGGAPTRVFEIDRTTWTEIPGSEEQHRPAITDTNDFFGGYERGRRELFDDWMRGLAGQVPDPPCQEAAWMTSSGAATTCSMPRPGTVTHWYCDTVMEGESATALSSMSTTRRRPSNVGGFIGSAGHSSVLQDRHGNWWRATTMWIGVHDLFDAASDCSL